MLEENATVVKAIDQDLWVQTDRQTGCSACVASKSCGISLIDKLFNPRPALLHVNNLSVSRSQIKEDHVGNTELELKVRIEQEVQAEQDVVSAQVGDKVVVGIEENAILKASFLVYFLPLVFMIGFALIGHFLFLPVSPVVALTETNSAMAATNNGIVVLFSLSGLVAGFICVSAISKKINHKDHYRIRLLKNITEKHS